MIIQISKVLDEGINESRVYIDDELEIFAITPSFEDWKNKLYIKVFTKDKKGKFSKVTRLSMLKPEYMECEYPNVKLSKEQLNHLIKALNVWRDGDDCEFDDNITIWQLIILANNVYRRMDDESMERIEEIPKDLPIPDYTVLAE